MAARRRVVVIGAMGVFGRLLSAELEARGDIDVVRAARHGAPLTVDVNDVPSVRRAADGAFAVACAAGPFQAFDRAAVRSAVESGAHWLDISDDPGWFFGLLDDKDLDREAKKRGVVVAPGLSTLPAISGALVRRVLSRHAGDNLHAKFTLWIGNRNSKGAASIASALASDGRGLITPDAELLRRELGITATAAVEFQMPGATAAMRVLGGIRSPESRARIGRIVSALSAPLSRLGTDRAVLRVEIGEERDEVRGRGQRLAILPLAYVFDRLLAGAVTGRGCLSPAQVVDSENLLKFVEAGA